VAHDPNLTANALICVLDKWNCLHSLAPVLCLQLNDVYMGRLEENFLYKTEWSNSLIIWVRFIDDIFIIWKGDKNNLIKFIDYLHNVVPSIKFTQEISNNSVNLLDTTSLRDMQNNISTDVYQKPTDTHPYLHWTHPPYPKQSILCSPPLRLR